MRTPSFPIKVKQKSAEELAGPKEKTWTGKELEERVWAYRAGCADGKRDFLKFMERPRPPIPEGGIEYVLKISVDWDKCRHYYGTVAELRAALERTMNFDRVGVTIHAEMEEVIAVADDITEYAQEAEEFTAGQ